MGVDLSDVRGRLVTLVRQSARGITLHRVVEQYMARYGDMTAPTIRAHIKDLIEEGLIVSTGRSVPTTRGRQATLWSATEG